MGILDVPSYSKAQSDARYPNLNKVLPGRYTLPKRTAFDVLQSFTVMSNPPVISSTTSATITNGVLVYPGSATGTGSNFTTAFDATKSPYFLYHGNVMKAAGTSSPDNAGVQGSLNNGYPFYGGSYYVEFDYDGSQFEIAYKDIADTNKGMIFIDGQPAASKSITFGSLNNGSTRRTLVKFVDPTFTPVTVTAASSNNTTTVSYTVASNSTLSVGDTVSITGLSNPTLNLSGVTIFSVTGTNAFTVKTVTAVPTASVTGQSGLVTEDVRATRRVTLAFSAPIVFYGVYRQPTATLCKPPSKITSILWQGDSFTEGTGSNTLTNDGYATIVSKLLGIDEVFNVAQGGTGFLQASDIQNTGAKLSSNITASQTSITVTNIADFNSPTYPFSAWIGAERVSVSTSSGNVLTVARGQSSTVAEPHYANDAVLRGSRPIFRARNFTDLSKLTKIPDIIAVAGGHNDINFDTNRLSAEILTYFRSLRVLFPTSIIVGLSPLPTFGVEVLSANWWKARDYIKTAMADSQVNGVFIDVMELPLRYTPASTTLSSNYTSGTSITTVNYISIGATIELGNLYGTWGGRRIVTGISGSGPYTLTLNSAPETALSLGTTVTEVGPCIFTGTGYQGALNLNNSGNTDFMISSDGAHPSPAGHRLLAEEIVNQLVNSQIVTRL